MFTTSSSQKKARAPENTWNSGKEPKPITYQIRAAYIVVQIKPSINHKSNRLIELIKINIIYRSSEKPDSETDDKTEKMQSIKTELEY